MTKSLSFKKTSLALAVALSLPVISVQAAESYKAQDVVVTASRVEQQLADVNMSVSVITSEEIEKNSGAKTIADLLESTVPGVRVNNDGGQGIDRIKIRGEDSFRTVVMIDGQRISEQKSMSGVPLLIDPSQVERIEVIRGPASVLYGSDAIGGAINIITKKGSGDAFNASVSAGFNSASNGKDVAASIYGATNGWKYRIGASTQNYDNLDTPAGEMENTDFSSKAADFSLSYDIDQSSTIGISASYYDLDFNFGNISSPTFQGFVPEWKRARGGIFAEFKNLSDTLVRLRLDSYFEHSTKEMMNRPAGWMRPGMAVMEVNANNKLDSYGFSAQTDWQLGDSHYLIAGYEFNQDELDADSWLGGFVATMMPFDHTYDGTQTRHAVFASMDSSVTENLVLNYGVRYTWVNGDTTDLDNKTNLKSKADSSDSKAVFNAGLTFKGFENLTLRANWSQGYRAPILQELYIDSNMGGETTLANPDLKPETSNNFEVGARYQNDWFTSDLAVFYSDADDYITTVTTTGGIEKYTNVGKAKTIGLELDTRLALRNFEPYTVLTLLRREYEENGIETTKSGTPKITARYGVRYNREYEGAHFNVDAYAVTQSATETNDLNPDPTKREEHYYGGATTLNLTGGVSFGPDNKYALNAGLYNITNKKYKNNGAIYEAERHFAVKFNATF